MFASLLALAWMDLFVPTGMAIVMVLLSVVKKRSHVLYYIFGSYFTYVLAATAIFLGADIYVRRLWGYLTSTFPLYIGILKLGIGVCDMAGFAFTLCRAVRIARGKKGFNLGKAIPIKSIHPLFILMIGVVQYLAALPSCINLFAFIAILVSGNAEFPTAVFYISIFCSVSILPKLVVYILSFILDTGRFQRIMAVVGRIASAVFLVIIPIMFLAVALWSSISGIGDIILHK